MSKNTASVHRGFRFALQAITVWGMVIGLVGCQGVSSSGGGSGQPTAGTLVLGTQSLNFGTVSAGAHKSLSVVATNSGSAAVNISSASVSGKYFSLTSPAFPTSIAAGKSATLNVDFTPAAVGTFNGTITFAGNASNAPLSLSVSGTGTTSTTAGQLTVSPTTLAVGNVVDGTSASASGTVTASGAPVTITTASANNSLFSVSGLSLPVTIAAGQSVSYSVTFSPVTTGPASAALTFTSDAQPSTVSQTVTGTGTAAPTHSVSLSWNASASPNIAGYNVYRAVYGSSCGTYTQINSLLNTTTLYTDSNVVSGQSYCYASTAVDTSNQESAYSNIVSGVSIPTP